MIGLVLGIIVSTSPPQGALDPNVTVEKLCTPGYTATVRPPVVWTNSIKRRSIEALHLPNGTGFYELDHFIAIEDGGCPDCPENLWLQPWTTARHKDVDETHFHHEICAGRMTLEEAQANLRAKWGNNH